MQKTTQAPSFNATFLTPVKLCKCLLICYYVQNEKSSEFKNPAQLYKLGVYLVGQLQDFSECENQYSWEDIETQLNDSLKEHASSITEWLLTKLRQITSPDYLFDIFQQFEELVDAGNQRVNHMSVFSVYLRLMVLTFEKMLFPGISRLFSQLQSFIPLEELSDEEERIEEEEEEEEEEYRSWQKIEEKWFPSLIGMRERCTSSLPYGALSPLEVEQYVASEAKKIQKLLLEGKETREELRARINHLHSMSPNVGALHYLSYLCEIEQRDLLRSIDELHRYYDYQIHQYTSSIEAFRASTSTIPASLTNLQDHSLRNLLPYASLHLASLHFSFHNEREGFQCIKEAIRMAQGCSDSKGLTNALSCLYNFIRSTRSQDGVGNREKGNGIVSEDMATLRELLEKCIGKAEELGLAQLASSNSLALAELFSLSPPSSTKWKLLSKSDELNVRHNLMEEMYSKNNLMRSSCWANLGHLPLAAFYANLPLRLNALHTPIDDICTSSCKAAYHLSLSGSFLLAFRSLLLLQSSYPKLPTSNPTFVRTSFTILSNFFLNRGEVGIVRQYRVYEPEYGEGGEGREGEIEVLMREGRHSQALSRLLPLLHRSSRSPGLSQKRIRYLMYLAAIYQQVKQPLVALDHILTCLSLASSYQLHSVYAEASLDLIEIYLALHQWEKARSLLHTVQSQVLLHCSLSAQAKLHTLKAKLVIMEIGRPSDPLHHPPLLEEALEELEEAYEKYERLECLAELIELHYLRSLLFSSLHLLLPSHPLYRRRRNEEAKSHAAKSSLLSSRLSSSLPSPSSSSSSPSLSLASSLLALLTSS